MKTFTGKNRFVSADGNRLATLIAGVILKAQTAIAQGCARNFNAWSLRKKKFIALTVTMLFAGFLLSGVFSNGYTIPALKFTYKPATHIGLASDVISAIDKDTPLTDSLTKNY